MNLHPQFIGQNGTKEYVVLPIGEFRAVAELIEDFHDLQDLHSAKETEATATTTSLADIVKQMDLKGAEVVKNKVGVLFFFGF